MVGHILFEVIKKPTYAHFSTFFLVMTIKKYLADLYVISDLEKLTLKIKYYQEFLDVIGKVDRGYPPVRLHFLEKNSNLHFLAHNAPLGF